MTFLGEVAKEQNQLTRDRNFKYFQQTEAINQIKQMKCNKNKYYSWAKCI